MTDRTPRTEAARRAEAELESLAQVARRMRLEWDARRRAHFGSTTDTDRYGRQTPAVNRNEA